MVGQDKLNEALAAAQAVVGDGARVVVVSFTAAERNVEVAFNREMPVGEAVEVLAAGSMVASWLAKPIKPGGRSVN